MPGPHLEAVGASAYRVAEAVEVRGVVVRRGVAEAAATLDLEHVGGAGE